MSIPPDVFDVTGELERVYARAQARLRAEEARIAANPRQWRRLARVRELQATIAGYMDEVDGEARDWVETRFPTIYEAGAQATAVLTGQPFTWTQVHREALTEVAGRTYDHLLAATAYVRDDVKRVVAIAAKAQIENKVATGRTAVAAGRDLARDLEARGLRAVTYADGTTRTLDTYAQMVLRTTTAQAYNIGAFRQADDVEFWEVFDGADCGWEHHDDPRKANGLVVPRPEAENHLIAHPNCRRSFGPRPDVTSAEEAAGAEASTTPEQRADQADAERRQAAQVARRQTIRDRHAARTGQTARRREERLQRLEQRRLDLEDQADALEAHQRTLETTWTRDAETAERRRAVHAELAAQARADLPTVRAAIREDARQTALEGFHDLDTVSSTSLARPPRRTVRKVDRGGRLTADVETNAGGEWDWLYQLHPDEQKRVRRWMGEAGAPGPDQIHANVLGQGRAGGGTGLAGLGPDPSLDEVMDVWLDYTRRIDAGGAVARGKIPADDAYGHTLDLNDLAPNATADGFDVATILGDEDRAAAQIADVYREQYRRDAERILGPDLGGRYGPPPWQMDPDAYADELLDLESRIWDGTASAADVGRWEELAPEGLDVPGPNGRLQARDLHAAIVRLADLADL